MTAGGKGSWRCGCFCFFLKSGPSRGYQLVERLGQALGGGGFPDPGTVYTNLRRMEQEGLVSSSWDLQDSGPRRRLYRLTEQGEELLHVWAANVEHYRARLDRFLSLYRELAGDSQA